MTHMYGARGSFHVLRPKNTIKLPTQSAEKWICMGKRAGPSGGIYFHHIIVVRFVADFFSNDRLFRNSSVEYTPKTDFL